MKLQPVGDAELHFWLTRSVAKVMGISFSEAITQGRITVQDYASLVTACRSCALVESCQTWLGSQKSQAKNPPPGCANASDLGALAKSHRAGIVEILVENVRP